LLAFRLTSSPDTCAQEKLIKSAELLIHVELGLY